MMNKKVTRAEGTSDVVLALINVCVLLVALIVVIPVGNWGYMALICLLMAIQVGVMAARIAGKRRKDDGKEDRQ
ncbi:DUF2207 domain-containing protein [Pseudoscardovia suis]|uniref:DUF2207 domain-containing protein n=1 Tax=Pseudoscardovia suis TaxID=987063 RepID=UPI00119825C8|nr:DUF2207 domain-containing protein [Pseudoscardovia suis]